MVLDRGIEWAASAGRHGWTLDDVIYAVRHSIRSEVYRKDGEMYLALTGEHHGDPLVPSLEVVLKTRADGRIVVFHVNAEQDGFWNNTERYRR